AAMTRAISSFLSEIGSSGGYAMVGRGRGSLDKVANRFGNGEARSEPWRFDAVQIDETCDPVIARPLDDEVTSRLAGARQLWSYANICRKERIVCKARVIRSDSLVKGFFPGLVEPIVDAVGPRDVRAEAGSAGEVERDVDAEAPRDRHRVDEPVKR